MKQIFTAGLRNYSLTLVLLLISFIPALGQGEGEEKIKSDRPDQSQAPSVVQKRTVQVEVGYQYQHDTEAGVTVKTQAYPTALVRLGLTDKIELRLQSALRDSVVLSEPRRKVVGSAPLSVGAKVQLWEERGWLPEAGIMAMVAMPIGSKTFRPDRLEPQFRLAFLHSLGEKLELQYNLVQGWIDGNAVPGYTVNLSAEASDMFTVYAEIFGSKEVGGKAMHQVNGGLMFFPLKQLQLDVAAGYRLNEAAPDLFITGGFSVRLPR